ncbi:MAG: FkbM family methyltransferase, partial [Alphaproteobacteria bacterium]|nr:FkbM family methyltransferase [Alphaproteobacteria bacterium]
MLTQRPFHSYAQNLEDIVLWRALHGVKEGRYIDIGACDPRIDSVSRGFYEQGWRGVHFEPVRAFAERIREDRPDETVHEIALSDRCGEIEFFVSPNKGLSTGIVDNAKPGISPCRVVARTLAACSPELGAGPIHWMKIDVEGMEAAVLRGWDPAV